MQNTIHHQRILINQHLIVTQTKHFHLILRPLKRGVAGLTTDDRVITTHHGFCIICCYGDLLVLWGRGHSRAVRASTLIGELQPQFIHLLHVSHCRQKKDETKSRTTSVTLNMMY